MYTNQAKVCAEKKPIIPTMTTVTMTMVIAITLAERKGVDHTMICDL